MNSLYLLFPILFPVVGGILIFLIFMKKDNVKVRKGLIAGIAVIEFLSLLPLLKLNLGKLRLFTLTSQIEIALHVDKIGLYFALIMSFVWACASFYSFHYMDGEKHLPSFYCFFLCSLGVLMGLCFSESLITYYMFYEMMTLLSFPLVCQDRTKEAIAAAFKYLFYSVAGASMVLCGTAMLAPYVSTFSFAAGGRLDPTAFSEHRGMILAAMFLIILGFSVKCGMFPLHDWLPTAHPIAPAPVSGVLSGIITKAGVLGITRSIFYVFGPEYIRGTWVQLTVVILALFTIFSGSLLAWRETVLKKRLAYSSISQVSYVLIGIFTLETAGFIGAMLHVLCHALIKNALFMCAGGIIHQTGKKDVSEMEGVGKEMPYTMAAFTLASVCLVGVPPFAGFISKWYLAQGGLAMTSLPSCFNWLVPAILLISALLTAVYLFPVATKAFLIPHKEGEEEITSNSEVAMKRHEKEMPLTMLIPVIILAVLSLIAGTFPGGLINIFTGIAGSIM